MIAKSDCHQHAERAKDKQPNQSLRAREDGKFWSEDSWKRPFKDAVLAASLPLDATAYDLRHSTIANLIDRHNLDIMTVAQLSDISLAMHYPSNPRIHPKYY